MIRLNVIERHLPFLGEGDDLPTRRDEKHRFIIEVALLGQRDAKTSHKP